MDAKSTFSSIAVKDIEEAKRFYIDTLGLRLSDDKMGLDLELPGGGSLFVYSKEDHEPAGFTLINFIVDDIEAVVDALAAKGVTFEHYDDGPLKTDDKGIARGKAANMGPDIAWFKDPSGNFLSVLEPV